MHHEGLGPRRAVRCPTGPTRLAARLRSSEAPALSSHTHIPAALRERFDLTGPLGVGARGVVWSAVDARGTRRAVKTPQRPQPADAAMLKAEYRALVRCCHPHIVTPHRLVVKPSACWLELDLVPGVRINRWARSLPAEWSATVDQRIRRVGGQLVSAVAAVHRHGLVHRDLKPENILVDDTDRLVLLDFDLAAPPNTDQTRGSILGTPGYRPPEQGLGLPIGPAADWYAVGAVLHEVLVGRPPFGKRPRASLRAQRRLRPPDLLTVRPDLPADIAAVVHDLLQPEPTARPTRARLEAIFPRPEAEPGEPAVTRGTLDQLRRTLDGPHTAWVDLLDATDADRRHARVQGTPTRGHDVVVRVDPAEDVPHRLLDAIAAGVVQVLRRLPRDQRSAVLPRDRVQLLDSFPDFVLLPELSSFVPGVGTGDPRALAQVLLGLSDRGGLRLVLEDLHRATPADLEQLERLLALSTGCSVVTEGEPIRDPKRSALLRSLRKQCTTTKAIRVRSVPPPV